MALIRLCSFDFYLISYLSMLLARQCKSLKMVGIEHMYGKSIGCYSWTIYEIVFSCFSLTKVSHGWPQSKMTLDYQNISHFVLLRVFFFQVCSTVLLQGWQLTMTQSKLNSRIRFLPRKAKAWNFWKHHIL